jgi:hypothetical protein
MIQQSFQPPSISAGRLIARFVGVSQDPSEADEEWT